MQLKSLQHVLGYFIYANRLGLLSGHVKLLMAETLIAASSFSDPAWKFKALGLAEQILLSESDPYLEVWAFLRRGLLTRLHPDKISDESNAVSKLSAFSNRFPYDRRSGAQNMRLILARAHELIDKDRFTEALSHLELIDLSEDDNPSTLERIVLRQKEFAVGRIFRFQGRFQEALECFKRVLPHHFQFSKSERSIISHIAGTLIETGDPINAEEILQDELRKYQNHDKILKITLAEAELHQKSFKIAEDICLELKKSYEDTSSPDMNSDTFYLRVLTILARIAHLEGRLSVALSYWQSCLEALKVLEARGWEKENFSFMIIIYSIADIELKTGKFMEAGERIEKAREIFRRIGRRHWFTGLGTIWFDAIGTSISRHGGCKIDH